MLATELGTVSETAPLAAEDEGVGREVEVGRGAERGDGAGHEPAGFSMRGRR